MTYWIILSSVSFLTHLKCPPIPSIRSILPLHPPHGNETVKEVGGDNITDERGVALLINHRDNVVPNVSLPLELDVQEKRVVRENKMSLNVN